MNNSSLNDIDDDDDDDEMQISDHDSVLAMAKRLDASSVISDPAFIEGASPHIQGVDPGGIGSGGVGGQGQGQRGGLPPGGLYARNHRDLDSIASVSSSSSSGSSSDSSMERNPRRGKQQQQQQQLGNNNNIRPMGQPRVGFHNNNSNTNNYHHNRGGGVGGPNANGYAPYEDVRGRRPTNFPDMGPPELNSSRGRQHQQQQQQQHPNSYVLDTGLPELNNNRGVRFAERGQRRIYNPHEDVSLRPPSPVGSIEGPPPNLTRRGRSRSPNAAGYARKGSNDTYAKDVETDKRERKRRIKLISIPFAVMIVIGAVIAVAVVAGKRGKEDEESKKKSYENQELIEIAALPTTFPTYDGLYNCPFGRFGTFPTKGCLGFVECNSVGETIGDPIYCPSGTLYDIRSNVCNHMNDVVCSTRLPSLSEENDPIIISNPITTPMPTPKPTALSSYTIKPPLLPPEYGEISELMGPTPTFNHKLAFVGVSSPGNMMLFQQDLQNYLIGFYSPENIATMNEDDAFRSLSDVSIGVAVIALENRRRLDVGAPTLEEDATTLRSNNIRGDHRRSLQSSPKFIATYNQVTTYRTSDPSITLGAIVRRPFDPEYSARLVEQLQQRDPVRFSTLTNIVFVEGMWTETTAPTVTRTAPPTADLTTRRPTNAPITGPPTSPPTSKRPTNAPTPPPSVETPEPTLFEQDTNYPSKRPSPAPTDFLFVPFPVTVTIQGLAWLDTNENGLFETFEPPMEGLFVNLRECLNDKWRATTSTSAIGQFQFVGIQEGEYYVDFFKPNPQGQYGFTIPRVGGTNIRILDSDVVILDENNGKSECMEVKDGFKQLTNAGYVLVDTAPPTPEPTAVPTPRPSTAAPTTAAPVQPRFCAEITELGDGTQAFDFKECSLPCTFKHTDCPDGMYCALTNDC